MPPEHRRLLIIDDEDDIREVASMSLEMTQGAHPDAILLDVMMPDLDGPSTLRLLQSRPETTEIPVIFLTAKVKEADRRKYLDLGAKAIIAKPFDPLTLGQQINDALGWALQPKSCL